MTDSTFCALAVRARAYQVVQRRNQISKVAFLARKNQDLPDQDLCPPCIVV
ncbi:hypothetical protein [uncultured Methanofollis sp.]|uniref:hypothetical protein n=1 Tax=uncultured Methanofollis sp. TaxID=262500 RepID=UPI002609AA63|nr:hypothetical protein [uncultured Methanofollis sp.]